MACRNGDFPDDLKVERVNVTIPALALSRFDAFAERHGLTRSGLFVEAVQRWIAENDRPPQALRKRLADLAQQASRESRPNLVDDLAEHGVHDGVEAPGLSLSESTRKVADRLEELLREPAKSGGRSDGTT